MATRTEDSAVSTPVVQRRSTAGARGRTWVGLLARVLSDAALAGLAFATAYWLRYRLEIGGDVQPGSAQPLDFFTGKIALLMVLTVVIFSLKGLYRLPRWASFLDEASIIASGATTAMAIVILYSFLQRFYPSRLIFIYAWALMIVFLLVKRLGTRTVRNVLWAHGIGTDRVLVAGIGRAGQRIMEYIYSHPEVGYRIVGAVDRNPPPEHWGVATEHRVIRPAYLGKLDGIDDIVREHQVDEVIIALPPTAHEDVLAIVQRCQEQSVGFTLVPDLYDLALDRVQSYEVGGLPVIGLKESRIAGLNYAIKRAMDIVIAATVLTVCAPLFAAIALAIKLDSPGPVLFAQERVGKNLRRFTCYKFRTMYEDAEERKAELQQRYQVGDLLFKLKDDPRRTRVGRFLRRTSLDELPQFLNVLRGDMSVVGPRPQVPAEVMNYEEWHHRRLAVTPGLTGLWQVNGRSDLSFEEMVRLDVYYAEHWSPWLDIKLILRTIPAVILGRGAY